MKKLIQNLIKSSFALIWIGLFYELLFNTHIRDQLFIFCDNNTLLAPFLLISTQLLLATFALPCSPLTVLAGALWGWQLGMLYSTLGTIFSALWTFFIGRFIVKSWFKDKKLEGWWLNISQLIAQHGWKASMIAYANPALPGSSLGYIFGASPILFKSFFFGVFAGTLPLQIIAVAIGSAASNITMDLKLTSILLLSMLTLCVVLYKVMIPYILDRMDNFSGKTD